MGLQMDPDVTQRNETITTISANIYHDIVKGFLDILWLWKTMIQKTVISVSSLVKNYSSAYLKKRAPIPEMLSFKGFTWV